MKILAINGSHRGKRGYTHFLVEKLFSGSRSGGAECEEVVLADLNIHRCTGCQACNKNDHLLRCIYEDKDDVAGVFEKMRRADILVYATPIYDLRFPVRDCFSITYPKKFIPNLS